MKKFMKFAAMAAAVLSLCVACEKDEELTIDGKQWVCEYYDSKDPVTGAPIFIPAIMDFGVTVPGKHLQAFSYDNGETFEEYVMGLMDYEIEPIDATSGVITIQGLAGPEKYGYSELTKNSVKFSPIEYDGWEPTFELRYSKAATLAKKKIAIEYVAE